MEEEKQDKVEKHKELLKEVLRRANKTERQEYDGISDRQDTIIDKIQEIYSELEQLSDRSSKIEYPKTVDIAYTLKSPEELMRMNSEETRLWSEQVDREIEENKRKSEDWNEKFDKWLAESSATIKRQIELTKEKIALMTELLILESKEKWLLLSIALRSQPNLLKYLQ
jgi:hypothetical protein